LLGRHDGGVDRIAPQRALGDFVELVGCRLVANSVMFAGLYRWPPKSWTP